MMRAVATGIGFRSFRQARRRARRISRRWWTFARDSSRVACVVAQAREHPPQYRANDAANCAHVQVREVCGRILACSWSQSVVVSVGTQTLSGIGDISLWRQICILNASRGSHIRYPLFWSSCVSRVRSPSWMDRPKTSVEESTVTGGGQQRYVCQIWHSTTVLVPSTPHSEAIAWPLASWHPLLSTYFMKSLRRRERRNHTA